MFRLRLYVLFVTEATRRIAQCAVDGGLSLVACVMVTTNGYANGVMDIIESYAIPVKGTMLGLALSAMEIVMKNVVNAKGQEW